MSEFSPPSRPSAIIFDLDGTLIDSRADIAHACNHALEKLGHGAKDPNYLGTLVGDGGRRLLARALGVPLASSTVEEAFALFLDYYREHPIDFTKYIPGAERVFDAFDVPIGLATNKSRETTLAILDALSIRDRFRAIFAGGDGPLKPDPFAMHFVANELRVSATQLWMVGDGPQDVGAAKSAGAYAVGVLGGFHHERLIEAVPDTLFGSMNAFVDAAAPFLGARR